MTASMTTRPLALLLVSMLCLTLGCGGHAIANHDGEVRDAVSQISTGANGWAVDHNDNYPPQWLVRDGKATDNYDKQPVGMYIDWPTNPYTGRPVRQGTSPGDFRYIDLGEFVNGRESVVEKPHKPSGCAGYRLTAYGLNGRPLAVFGQGTWDSALFFEQSSLRSLVEAWAQDHHRRLPPSRLVTQAGLGRSYAKRDSDYWSGLWPINPFTGQPLHSGTGPGDFRYVRKANGRFSLVCFGSNGKPVE
jgi:hypothetical protein